MPIPTATSSSTQAATPAAAPGELHGPDRFSPVALIAGVVFPGLGHWVLGERRRAIGIAAGVMGLFVSGVLIGGIDAVDRKENPVWFAGQSLVGPVAWGTDWYHQSRLKVKDPTAKEPRSPRPNEGRHPDGSPRELKAGEKPPLSKSLGKMNEMGTLFAAIAGMVNLIAIIDAGWHRRRRSAGA